VSHWQFGSAIFLGYLLLVAALPRGLRPGKRPRVVAGASFGLATLAVSMALPAGGVANVWVLPPALLLIGYWTSGLLFVAPMPGASADRFWSVVLFTDYVCFGMLPWFQTRPPRAMGFGVPWRSRWRGINVRLLDASSVQVNTFPSGHAAEALACALLVTGAPAPVVWWMIFNAVAISAGAVFGRYHYAADAIAGWAVALLVWRLL
jgi:hypothetical protein